MRPSSLKKTVQRLLIYITFSVAMADAQQVGWVTQDRNGKLHYALTGNGDHIMDFSYAGYDGGGVKLPILPVRKTVEPAGGDDSAAIQAAVDTVSSLPLENGFRGAVLLSSGTFHCATAITISKDGVVLRGSGPGNGGTVIEMTGTPHNCLVIDGGALKFAQDNPADTYPIADAYVPSGALSFSVKNAHGLNPGDNIFIRWLHTAAWIHFMGMDTLVRNGKPQSWIENDSPVSFQRKIRAVAGNLITIDVPLTDAVDSRFLAPNTALIAKTPGPRRLAQCGLESLRINSLPPSGTLVAKNNLGVSLDNCEDCWVRNISMHDTLGNVRVMQGGRRITIEGVDAVHTATVAKGAGYPSDFTLRGSQILVDRCSSTGSGSFFVATMNGEATLNAVLNCTFTGAGAIQPHARWSTGLLIDNCRLPDGKVDLINRGTAGSGHGWAIGWAVAWNCTAMIFDIQQPPGSMNWCIGCVGQISQGKLAKGEAPPQPGPWLSSYGIPVQPTSLYLAQLKERLGPQAVANTGY